jgi:hypothetical protein
VAHALPPRPPAAAAAAQEEGRAATAIADPGADFLAAGAMRAYARSDTTEFEFPEEDRKHLVRDVTVFVLVSVFVAYFIVKVFIQEDEEAPAEPPGGKPVPTQ